MAGLNDAVNKHKKKFEGLYALRGSSPPLWGGGKAGGGGLWEARYNRNGEGRRTAAKFQARQRREKVAVAIRGKRLRCYSWRIPATSRVRGICLQKKNRSGGGGGPFEDERITWGEEIITTEIA